MSELVRKSGKAAALATFGGEHYYPEGGWFDHIGTFATIEEARARVEVGHRYEWAESEPPGRFPFSWWHIVDLNTGKVVEASDMGRWNEDG